MSDTEQTVKLLVDLLRAKVVDFDAQPPLEWDAEGHDVTWSSPDGVKYAQTLTLTPYDTEWRRMLKIRALTGWIREMGTNVSKPIVCGTEADIRKVMGYSHIADKAVEALNDEITTALLGVPVESGLRVEAYHAVRREAQAAHVKAHAEMMTEVLTPVASEFAAKHGLPAPTLSFETGPAPEPGSYSNTFGGGMTAEAFESAVREIREQMEGKPLFDAPKPIDPSAIRARADKATPGPWAQEYFQGTVMLPGSIGEPMGHEATRDDHLFMGHARTDVPALLDVIDVLARLLLNPDWQLEKDGRLFLAYRPEEVIEALAALGLDTVEKRDAARSKLSWSGGGSLRATDTKPVGG